MHLFSIIIQLMIDTNFGLSYQLFGCPKASFEPLIKKPPIIFAYMFSLYSRETSKTLVENDSRIRLLLITIYKTIS